MAFFKVEVIDCCPTTVSKVAGLYFRAETMKLSILNLYPAFLPLKNTKDSEDGLSFIMISSCKILTNVEMGYQQVL
jgi:hypothetical protein